MLFEVVVLAAQNLAGYKLRLVGKPSAFSRRVPLNQGADPLIQFEGRGFPLLLLLLLLFLLLHSEALLHLLLLLGALGRHLGCGAGPKMVSSPEFLW